MSTQSLPLVPLADLADGQEADFFALLTTKESLQTRDGKPYFRVGFRDAGREVNFPIWSDSAWSVDCRDRWTPGEFYKLRAKLQQTNYGPQLEIRKIRPVTEADRADGFDPAMCQACSRFDPAEMFDELLGLAATIADEELRSLVVDLFQTHRETLLVQAAATKNHHAFQGGFLEHVLSVTRTCQFLADKYGSEYPDMTPALDRDLVLAGAMLHDIGKLRELELRPEGAVYTSAGQLIGHILQGRDMVREAAAGRDLRPETLLRLEHIIVSHQRLPEWGSPKPPMTPEALIVHYADDLDAKYQMMVTALAEDPGSGPLTSSKNPLRQKIYRGEAF